MKERLKDIYLAPEIDILELVNEGIVCDSEQSGNGTGEDFGWDS